MEIPDYEVKCSPPQSCVHQQQVLHWRNARLLKRLLRQWGANAGSSV